MDDLNTELELCWDCNRTGSQQVIITTVQIGSKVFRIFDNFYQLFEGKIPVKILIKQKLC